MARHAAANAKLMRQNRLDGALTSFRGSPTPEGMMELDRVLRLDGYDNATIRGHLTSEMTKVKSNAEFETLMRTPYGLMVSHLKSSTHRKRQNYVSSDRRPATWCAS